MDPVDYFLYSEFAEPGMQYECQHCGTHFGEDCVDWDDETQCQVAVCPACGQTTVLGEDDEDER